MNSKPPKWVQQHYEVALAQGLDWSKQFTFTDEDAEKFPALKELTLRMKDILGAKGVRLSEEKLRVIELSQSMGRGFERENSVGCCTPKWRPWLTTQNRFVVGHEALYLQGISYSDKPGGHEDLLEFDSSFLTDLAGNAFHAGQCSAMIVAMFCALGSALMDRMGVNVREAAEENLAKDAEAALDEVWG